MTRISMIGIAAMSLLLGATAPAYAQREQQGDNQKQEHRGDKKDDKKDEKKDDKAGKPDKPAAAAPQHGQEAKPQPPPQTRVQQQQQQQDRNKQLQQQQQDRKQPPPAPEAKPQAQPQQDRAQQRQQRQPQQRQKQLVDQQQQRLTQYRQHLDQQQRVLQQQAAQLQQQKRSAQYRFHEEYLQHLHQQQVFLNDHHPDYDRDPFFFSVFTFRYNRGGRYYETNQYRADRLREAANNGYNEGFRAGAANREDHWRFGYEDSYAYQDANYGYNGYYVDRDDYNYYFREGFRRGYEDGYYSRLQYGRNDNGIHVMLDINLSQLLGLEPIR